MSQAVIVERMPLVHTRQLFPLDREGKLVGEGSADQQIEQVLANLEAVLKESGSGLDKLIRVNVYALSTATVSSFREQLSKRLGGSVRPVITSILTPLAHRGALVAVDAVAGAADSGTEVVSETLPLGSRRRQVCRCSGLAVRGDRLSVRHAGRIRPDRSPPPSR